MNYIMKKAVLTINAIKQYENYLYAEEKSLATIEKYIRDITQFYEYLPVDKSITKEGVIDFKNSLLENYQMTSINSILAAINGLFCYLNIPECKVKRHKIQSSILGDESKELTKAEYQRLLKVSKARHNEKLYLLLQTICSTGIRVSELQFITVEAIKKDRVTIRNKGKVRDIILPNQLKKMLVCYTKKEGIDTGVIFITKNHKPINRSNIWKMMKSLCIEADVAKEKVFPHNLRHLFAISFYQLEKDIVRLADLLGHSSINTTRIYTKTSHHSYEHVFKKMNLLSYIS